MNNKTWTKYKYAYIFHFKIEEFTYDDSAEIPAKLFQHFPEIFSSQHLATNQEEDTHRCQWYDPGGDGHHGVRQAGEEVQQWLALVT